MIARLSAALSLFFAILAFPGPSSAWDDTGHMLVARLAWEQLRPETRKAAIELLEEAPTDALLYQLYPDFNLPEAELDRIFFERAATWPDKARDLPRYNHGNWHYVNRFWEQTSPSLAPIDRWDIQEETPNVVSKLYELERQLRDPNRPAAERAVDLAWVLHLVGDIHQPLHCSSRISKRKQERRGDRGGNSFALRGVPGEDLHGLWDFILGQGLPQQTGETYPDYLERLAETLRRPGLDYEEVTQRDFRTWADEGHTIAKIALYPPTLVRGREPSDEYVEVALEIAQRRMALAGKRLALYLERVLGTEAASVKPD